VFCKEIEPALQYPRRTYRARRSPRGCPRCSSGCPADAAASTARRDAEPTSTAGPEQQAQPPRATCS